MNVTGQHDRRIENLTRQIPNLAGHCPVTGRYFQPWRVVSKIQIKDLAFTNRRQIIKAT